ncbi:MAG: hypothetical protein BGO78_17025 [Chloroflexi bacterium 44-23]|nr:MAG: hypothetical protein BGO78_17025 [Chloroflexi bacterium 44-23]
MNEESISDPYATLALAVLFRAALDLKSKNPARVSEARTWLQFVGLSWCQMLGISEKEISTWVASNFTLPPNAHRNWRY